MEMIVPQQLTLDELAGIANEEHRLARQSFGSMLEHAIRAGEALVEARGKVDRGEWLAWLAGNFEGSPAGGGCDGGARVACVPGSGIAWHDMVGVGGRTGGKPGQRGSAAARA